MENNIKNQSKKIYNIVKILKDMVNIASFKNINNEHKIIKYLIKQFTICKEIEIAESEQGNANLLIGINTQLKDLNDCILLSGHIDTVNLGIKFKKCEVIDNKIYGLGTSDMKSFIASIIYNLEKLLKIRTPIVLSLTSDEETKFLGIKAILNELIKRNIKPNLVIVGEPTDVKFSFSNKGATWFTCSIFGKQCHASTPDLGINAIQKTVEILSEINKFDKKLDNSSLTVTKINGGELGNMVPEKCIFKLDIRLSKVKDYENIKSKLFSIFTNICENICDFNIEASKFTPPFEKRNSKFLKNFAISNNIDLIESNFTTEAGVIQQTFCTSNIVIFGPGNARSIHSENEYIEIDNLKSYSNLLMDLINEYDKFNNI